MVSEEPTRKMLKELKAAGFVPVRTESSHTMWQAANGVQISVPDGHRTISPGVVRKIRKAIEEAGK